MRRKKKKEKVTKKMIIKRQLHECVWSWMEKIYFAGMNLFPRNKQFSLFCVYSWKMNIVSLFWIENMCWISSLFSSVFDHVHVLFLACATSLWLSLHMLPFSVKKVKRWGAKMALVSGFVLVAAWKHKWPQNVLKFQV